MSKISNYKMRKNIRIIISIKNIEVVHSTYFHVNPPAEPFPFEIMHCPCLGQG